MDSPFLKDVSEDVSATEATDGIVLEKKLNLNESEDVEYCLNFLEWAALVLDVDGVRYLAAGTSTCMSIRSWTALYRRLCCIFDRLDSRGSRCR